MTDEAPQETPEKSFEQALKRLEEIVDRMEGGEVSLDESLSLFQEGIGLSRSCSTRLNDAEGRIRKLVRVEDGKFILEDFDSASDIPESE
ncbi:MAG: exodeoxyribonuclease VII small subunit [Candidatus Latescibacteria bacterium]|jgi:exodeoxyribonuclease VII small subunit|nr:exodeoxyribonuclease VII small subunit [Candidatus Latescibacterota bacterium]